MPHSGSIESNGLLDDWRKAKTFSCVDVLTWQQSSMNLTESGRKLLDSKATEFLKPGEQLAALDDRVFVEHPQALSGRIPSERGELGAEEDALPQSSMTAQGFVHQKAHPDWLLLKPLASLQELFIRVLAPDPLQNAAEWCLDRVIVTGFQPQINGESELRCRHGRSPSPPVPLRKIATAWVTV